MLSLKVISSAWMPSASYAAMVSLKTHLVKRACLGLGLGLGLG